MILLFTLIPSLSADLNLVSVSIFLMFYIFVLFFQSLSDALYHTAAVVLIVFPFVASSLTHHALARTNFSMKFPTTSM